MKYVIDSDKCITEKVPTNVAIILLALYNNCFITSNLVSKAVAAGYITYEAKQESNDYTTLRLTEVGSHVIETILLNSEVTEKVNNVDRFVSLANKLRDIYPQGRKEGTAYQWRDSTAVISNRLKALVKRYGNCFTDEQAINATKKYVQSFNGNYTYMQLLKYFIMKNNMADRAEDTSQLLAYIENEGQEDSFNMDNCELL